MLNEEHYLNLFHSKGWTRAEIQRALQSFRKAEEKKHPLVKLLQENLFWVGLIKAFITNLLAAFMTIPLLLYFHNLTLYMVLGVIGLSFGIVFHSVVKQLERLEIKHHVTSLIFLPLTIFLQFSLILRIAGRFATLFRLPPIEQGIYVILSYTVPYLIPYLILVMEDRQWRLI